MSGTEYQPVAGDFDGNGTDDIFWYGPGATADALWLWTTSRTHTSYARSVNTSTYKLAAGDVNGDGDDELLFANTAGDDVIWWGRPESSFGSSNQKPLALDNAVQPVFGDFDGDGKDDLFVYVPAGAGDTVWWGTAQADFGTTPVGLQAGATGSSTYRYDSSGLRSGKSVTTYASGVPSTATTTETWDSSGGLPLLLREKTGSSSTFLFYGPGGQPFEQINPDGSVLWLHRDQLGSVRLATDSTGTEAARRQWDAYGNTVVSTGSSKPLLGYAGQYTDAETGYQYLRARYYDPKTTQFLTLDPLVTQTGEPYEYAGVNPLNATDPTGLFCLGSLCTPDGPSEFVADAWDSAAGDQIAALHKANVHVAGFLSDHRHQAIDLVIAGGAGAAMLACGISVVCGVAVVGGAVVLGGGAHLLSDSVTDDPQRDFTPGQAFAHGGISGSAAVTCVALFGATCLASFIGGGAPARVAVGEVWGCGTVLKKLADDLTGN